MVDRPLCNSFDFRDKENEVTLNYIVGYYLVVNPLMNNTESIPSSAAAMPIGRLGLTHAGG